MGKNTLVGVRGYPSQPREAQHYCEGTEIFSFVCLFFWREDLTMTLYVALAVYIDQAGLKL